MNTNLTLLIVDKRVGDFKSHTLPSTSGEKDRWWQLGNVHYHN